MAKVTSTFGKADKQTAFVAKKLGMKPTARSGATLVGGKGDAQDSLSLLECKTYMKEQESMTVKKEWLTKMQKERFEDRKELAFLVQNFGGPISQDNYVVIDLDSFAKMYLAYKKSVEESNVSSG